jgi:hypothetical protein
MTIYNEINKIDINESFSKKVLINQLKLHFI